MRRAAVPILVLVMCLSGVGTMQAQDSDLTFSQALPPENTGHIRIGHFTLEAGPIAVFADGNATSLANLDYADISDWLALPAGAYELSFAPTNQPAGDTAVPHHTLVVEPRTWQTLALLDLQASGAVDVVILEENTGELLPGTTRVTFLNALDSGENVALYRDEIPYFTGTRKGNFVTEVYDTAPYLFQAVAGPTPAVLAELDGVELKENRTYLVVAIGSATASSSQRPQLVIAETKLADFRVGLGQLTGPGTVIQAIEDHNLMGDLAAAMEAVGLTKILEGEGPFTVFAPAEISLDTLPADDPEALADLLAFHIVVGEYYSQDLVNTPELLALNNAPLTLNLEANTVSVNGVPILTMNIPARNGVIHLLSEPLTSGAN